MTDAVQDLLAFLDASPSPYHAVATARRRLEADGYAEIAETDRWELAAGDRCTVVRGDGTVAAFEVGSADPALAGFRVIGAHTDSPNLRVRPNADAAAEGYARLRVEPYGGALLHTWMDRDLSLAGRVRIDDGDGLRTALVDFERPLLRVPNLAIHLYRELREEGLQLNPQKHLLPVVGLDDNGGGFESLLAAELERQGTTGSVLGYDLMTYDAQPATLVGAGEEFVASGRLDNLASCHAALAALAAAGPSEATRVVVLYDHEEVGSRSERGAAGPFLLDLLARICDSVSSEPQAAARAAARSTLVSADMAHAVHPNYADRHEPGHKPVIGRGPVVKTNANLSYATDGRTAADFARLCRDAGIEPQQFAVRADMPCGSTIGPISAARAGLATVDVGSPMLSMHSAREMAGAADVEPMIRVLTAFFDA